MLRRIVTGAICAAAAFSFAAVGFTATTRNTASSKTKSPATKTPPKVAVIPIPADWTTKTVRNVTVSVPDGWKTPSDIPGLQGVWFTGKDENRPNAAFSLQWNNIRIKDILSSATVKKESPIKLGDVDATAYLVKVSITNFEGLIVATNACESDGSRLMVMAGSLTGQWKQYEPTLRKMMDSIKIKKEEEKPPMTTPVGPEKPSGEAKREDAAPSK